MLADQLLAPTLAFLDEHLHPRRFLPQLAGECEVTHAGRAQSAAEAGDYLLTVKPDGCLMIHRVKGVKPRNWQPATDRLSATLEDGLVVMPGERRSPPEVVTAESSRARCRKRWHRREAGPFVQADAR